MYIMRLDDASEYWDKSKWQYMHDLLSEYCVKPIVAIIPHNEDVNLLKYPIDEDFLNIIHSWIDEGWTPALHGYNHVLDSKCGGINPVNHCSEFAGKDYEEQSKKITKAIEIFEKWGINTKVFVAPAHTFDNNTLKALRLNTSINVISDTIANDCYYENGFYFIPQQSGIVRETRFRITTFCYHPNTISKQQIKRLESFLQANNDKFISFDQIVFTERKKSSLDKILTVLYFGRSTFKEFLH